MNYVRFNYTFIFTRLCSCNSTFCYYLALCYNILMRLYKLCFMHVQLRNSSLANWLTRYTICCQCCKRKSNITTDAAMRSCWNRVMTASDTLWTVSVSVSMQGVMQVERRLGGYLLDKPKQMLFHFTAANLCVSIEDFSPGWRCKQNANYQVDIVALAWTDARNDT